MNLRMRMIREISLWNLFAQEAHPKQQVNPFERHEKYLTAWRSDRDLWRLFFAQIKPKDRVQNLWDKDGIWDKSTQLVHGVLRYQSALDALIARSSLHWKLHRMGGVDRNILRLASYELCFYTDIPAKAVLNEAIELGKRYGSIDSGRFINGVLDRIAQDLGRVETRTNQQHPRVEITEINRKTT